MPVGRRRAFGGVAAPGVTVIALAVAVCGLMIAARHD